MIDHPQVGFDASDEIGSGAVQFLHQVGQLAAELGADADERQLAPVARTHRRAVDEQPLQELVVTLLD